MTGSTTRMPPTSTKRVLPLPSAASSSSTLTRRSAPSSPTLPPPAATRPRCSASSTPCRPATSTASPPPSTGCPVTTSLSLLPSPTPRPRSCSLASALSSLTSDSPASPRLRRCVDAFQFLIIKKNKRQGRGLPRIILHLLCLSPLPFIQKLYALNVPARWGRGSAVDRPDCAKKKRCVQAGVRVWCGARRLQNIHQKKKRKIT